MVKSIILAKIAPIAAIGSECIKTSIVQKLTHIGHDMSVMILSTHPNPGFSIKRTSLSITHFRAGSSGENSFTTRSTTATIFTTSRIILPPLTMLHHPNSIVEVILHPQLPLH